MKNYRLAALAPLMALAVVLGVSHIVRADELKIDDVHSFALFDVHHLSAGYVFGNFSGVTGTINSDAGAANKTSFDVKIDATTIETRNSHRNDDLKGPDWFDVKQFPEMTFKSTSVKDAGDKKLEVTGDLTIHGVTKSVTVQMENTGTGKGPKGEERTGFLAHFNVNRGDFKINPKAPPEMVGEEVHITIALEAIKQQIIALAVAEAIDRRQGLSETEPLAFFAEGSG